MVIRASRVRAPRSLAGTFPVVVAGEFVGALDFFKTQPGELPVDQLAGAVGAAELAGAPLLDLMHSDLQGDGGPQVNPDFAGGASPIDPQVTLPAGGHYQEFTQIDQPY